MEYRLVVDSAPVRVLISLPPRLRERMLDRLELIARSPDRYSEFQSADATGRPLEGHIFASYAIWYWIDFPVREVRVIRIRPADQRP
ncbi:MAG TPA: hypothetical protein VGO11_08925 [Chthoniobacteraceae bacterium]|jgi:hypothetical protein|nr:hypothetical protein [Chthoniobacteraceae bacterium]